jgi:hypothetical protein
MQKSCKDELALQHTRFDKKKVSFLKIHNTWNMILRFFLRETCKWFRFIKTSATLTMSNIILQTARNLRYLHLLLNAFSWVEKHCITVVHNQSMIENRKRVKEWTSYVEKHMIWQEKDFVFYITNLWNMILSPFRRVTCRRFRFIWTSTTFKTSNLIISTTRSLGY